MLSRDEIRDLLSTSDPDRVARLYADADRARRENVGDAVHLRGLVEISNHCRRRCAYCGVHAGRVIERYRMTPEEILDAARRAESLGYGTLVMQAGEDALLDGAFVASVVGAVKEETGLAVTLSLGERSAADYRLWRAAGADRYLLRFETSDQGLFNRIHPPRPGRAPESRMAHLEKLRGLGYEVGSGVMVGIPGQSRASLADDIRLFHELNLDMIGIGPYLPHPETDLARHPERFPDAGGEQVPADEETVCRAVALARLVQPRANIPATTALALINRNGGREHGLARGANVVMPNLTPLRYRRLYEIYPAKADAAESAETARERLAGQLAALGRTIGVGRGDSPNHAARRPRQEQGG